MASLMCLPVVVCNLGVEMLYILEQRLRAQSVPEEKAVKVLHDVVTAMFDPAFVDELFKPQPAYTQRSMRRIMDKLAHSSIMRLSESSMDKLYDLVTMGLKYQLVTCRERAREILTVTLFHLAHPQELPHRPQSDVHDRRRRGATIRVTYAGFPKAGWHALRQTLFRFLADKQIKVSLFLQENLQNDERILRSNSRVPIVSARALGPVGTVTRHDGTSGARETTRLDVRFDVKSTPPHRVPPGGNMYAAHRQAETPDAVRRRLRRLVRTRHGARPRRRWRRPSARRDRRLETEGVVVVVVGDFERRGGGADGRRPSRLHHEVQLRRGSRTPRRRHDVPWTRSISTFSGETTAARTARARGRGFFGGGRSRVIEFKGDAGNRASV